MIDTEEKINEFLLESNEIEQEFGQEALEDAKEAWDYAYRNRKRITLKYVLKIHRLLLQRLRPDIAGKVRNCTVYIGGHVKEKKPKDMLHKELNQWIDNCVPKDTKATEEELQEWHIKFEAWHGFEDGNGRVGRILWQIQRINNRHPIKIIHVGKEQYEYYKWFK